MDDPKHPYEFFSLKVMSDPRGKLVPMELRDYIEWEVKRVYFCYDVTALRGGHCHYKENEIFICAKGSFVARLHDGKEWVEKRLVTPGEAVRVDHMVWHEFDEFSEDAVMLAISSTNHDTGDYVREFDEFLKLHRG